MISSPMPLAAQVSSTQAPSAPTPGAPTSDGAAPTGGFGQLLRLITAEKAPSQDGKRSPSQPSDPAAALSLLAMLPLLAPQPALPSPPVTPPAPGPGQPAPDASSTLPPDLAVSGMLPPGGSLPPAPVAPSPGGSLPPAPVAPPPGGSLPPAPATLPEATLVGSQEASLSAAARVFTTAVPAAPSPPPSGSRRSSTALEPPATSDAPAQPAGDTRPADTLPAPAQPQAPSRAQTRQPATLLATTAGPATPAAPTPAATDSTSTQPTAHTPAAAASIQSRTAVAPAARSQAGSKPTVVAAVADTAGAAGVTGANGPAPGHTAPAAAGAGANPAPATASVPSADLLRQVKELHQEALTQMPRSVEVVLRPEELGRVALRLSMAPDGSLQAHMQVTQAAVKTALESGLNDLQRQLQSQGLNLTGFAISVGTSSGGPAGDGSAAGQRREERSPGRRAQEVSAVHSTSDSPVTATGQTAANQLVGRLLDHMA